MFTFTSLWVNIASVVVGCTMLVAFGMLFVRASNVERRWAVAISTFIGAGLGLMLLYNRSRWGWADDPASFVACALCVAGFLSGRLIDWLLGERSQEAIAPDPATYGADLAD